MILLFYIFLYIPVWLIFRFTTNYSVLIGCRNFLKYSFFILCIFCLLSMILDKAFFAISGLSVEEIVRKEGEAVGFYLLAPLLWNIWMALWGLKYYDSTHIENLDYFVLYLRSFKDDNKKTRKEHMLMRALYSFFCPFAIGRPGEINSSDLSAIKLYVDDEWKENVLDMMERAPIILLRVSDTDNFFWEFEQCVVNKHIDKSLFWVSDMNSYSKFCTKAMSHYDIDFPSIDCITDNCIIFKEADGFSVMSLKTKKSYKRFVQEYNTARMIVSNYYNYFCGRNKSLIKQFFTWQIDPSMIDEVRKWCWTAFLFPEFYIIFQRFPNRGWMYILSIVLFMMRFVGGILLSIWLIPMYPLSLLFFTLLLKLPLMIYIGRNGKKWYGSQKNGKVSSILKRFIRIIM